MVNRPKAQGTAAESAVLRCVQANGFPSAYRQVLHGAADHGDLWLCKGVIIEVKDWDKPSIPLFLRETEIERRNAKADFAFCVYKKPGVGYPNAHLWPAVIRAGWLFDVMPKVAAAAQPWPQGLAWRSKAAHGHKDDLDMYEVTMTLHDMLRLLRVAGYGEEDHGFAQGDPGDGVPALLVS